MVNPTLRHRSTRDAYIPRVQNARWCASNVACNRRMCCSQAFPSSPPKHLTARLCLKVQNLKLKPGINLSCSDFKEIKSISIPGLNSISSWLCLCSSYMHLRYHVPPLARCSQVLPPALLLSLALLWRAGALLQHRGPSRCARTFG